MNAHNKYYDYIKPCYINSKDIGAARCKCTPALERVHIPQKPPPVQIKYAAIGLI